MISRKYYATFSVNFAKICIKNHHKAHDSFFVDIPVNQRITKPQNHSFQLKNVVLGCLVALLIDSAPNLNILVQSI